MVALTAKEAPRSERCRDYGPNKAIVVKAVFGDRSEARAILTQSWGYRDINNPRPSGTVETKVDARKT